MVPAGTYSVPRVVHPGLGCAHCAAVVVLCHGGWARPAGQGAQAPPPPFLSAATDGLYRRLRIGCRVTIEGIVGYRGLSPPLMPGRVMWGGGSVCARARNGSHPCDAPVRHCARQVDAVITTPHLVPVPRGDMLSYLVPSDVLEYTPPVESDGGRHQEVRSEFKRSRLVRGAPCTSLAVRARAALPPSRKVALH